jgi:hypothetical protein
MKNLERNGLIKKKAITDEGDANKATPIKKSRGDMNKAAPVKRGKKGDVKNGKLKNDKKQIDKTLDIGNFNFLFSA